VLIGILVFYAAREGMLGKQMKKITVEIVRKEKPPEKPPKKPRERPVETKLNQEAVKTETPKPVPAAAAPRAVPKTTGAVPPPATTVAPAVAPPAVDVPAFDFEGGKTVETTSDPNVLYKGFVEYTLRSRWNRPDSIADSSYVAEVEVTLDREGRLLSSVWKKGSGDTLWDNSVKKALADTRSIGRPPPKGFPEKVVVRFDVQAATEIGIE
jgi:protein TonB